MSKQVIRVDSYEQAVSASVAIMNLLKTQKPYTVTIEEGNEPRRSKQNRLSLLWYREIGKQSGYGAEYERRHYKLSFGVPMLRADDAEFNQFCETALDKLPYEQQLQAMEYVPVTRLMKVKQFAEYLNEVELDAYSRGYKLSQPDDAYWEALMKDA